MATHTLGTTTTTKLTCLKMPGSPPPWQRSQPVIYSPSASDVATLNNQIKNDMVNISYSSPAGPIWPSSLSPQGQPTMLSIPNRGVLQILPGDYVAIDTLTGWPILVSYQAVNATGSFWSYV